MESTLNIAPGNPPPTTSELAEAARVWGIEPSYWDMWGNQHHASPELMTAILASVGVDAGTHESLHAALEERRWQDWSRTIGPAVVVTQDTQEIAVSVNESQASCGARIEIRFEDGGLREIPVELGKLGVFDATTLRGQRFVRKRIPLGEHLPLGYHDLSIRIGENAGAVARLIVCPSRAYRPEWLESRRAAGLAISLYGVRSGRNWGCGDTTDLRAIVDWAAQRADVSFVALNPLHSIPNREPYNISPYLPNSIFYRNPLYLDIERMEDFQACPEATRQFATSAVEKEISSLRASEFVKYGRVYKLKQRFLKLLFRAFWDEWKRQTVRAAELASYIEREGELLHKFAVHAALDVAIHSGQPDVWNWRSWPAVYQDPDSKATREFVKRHSRGILFHKYVQWQLDRQFQSVQEHARERGLPIGLYHDLALATDRFGCDVWAHRDFFVDGCRVGAPPDAFSPKGQDWAFPPPNSERHYEDGYRLFGQSVRKNSRHGGALRIDHVMRFFRLFWIPDGMDASQGTYVKDRFEDLLGVMALESVREKFMIVGEDLGTVPDEVREALARFGIFGYRVFYFEQDGGGRFRTPQEYPAQTLVSATTHDLPTLAGFWIGRDIESRRQAGLLPDDSVYRGMLADRAVQKQKILDLLHAQGFLPGWFARNAADVPELSGELHNAIVGFVASTNSKLMVLNQEDLLKETEQQNLPGSTAEYPNWRRKMKCTVEELWDSPAVSEFTKMVRAWMDKTGRGNEITANERE